MFEHLKGMAGLAGLLKDLPKIKASMEQVKERLANQRVEAETGGGAVRVTVSGLIRVLRIEVDHAALAALLDPSSAEDHALAEDLIAGAVNAGIEKARRLAEREVASAAAELGIPLPPGGLGGLMG